MKEPRQTSRQLYEAARGALSFSVYARRQPEIGRLIREVRDENLTYLLPRNLADLADAVEEIDSAALPGAIVEAGTALGGSAIVLARVKESGRPLKLYDTFGMIPPPSQRDGRDVHERYQQIAAGRSKGLGGDTYYGYRTDLAGEVRASLERHGVDLGRDHVTLHQGLFEDALEVDYPVALAHIDADWYDSVTTCLVQIAPRLERGGRLVIDDYDTWSGARRAVDDFFRTRRSDYDFVRRSRLNIIRR